jgi:PHP family Zn ribbon phosphoesterase
MKVYGDLHIHSALSPCADEDMTPNNISNMAYLKGLNFIAVTDHNSMKNVIAVDRIASSLGVVLVPGMEIECREEVHLLCLFSELDTALQFDKIVYDKIPDIKNREKIFGTQSILNESDDIIGVETKLLLNAVDIGIDEVYKIVGNMGGVVIPSHIDRQSNSIISNLGSIPTHLDFKFLEISKNCSEITLSSLKKLEPNIDKYKYIRTSDAHNLGSILEREFCLDVSKLSAKDIILALS